MLADDVKHCDLETRSKHLVEAMGDAVYKYDRTGKPNKPLKIAVALAVTTKSQVDKSRRGVAQGQAILTGVDLARNL